MDLDLVTLESARAFLGGVALLQTVSAISAATEKDRRMVSANAIGAFVCATATTVYYRMESSGSTRLRYADWFVTCPAMLWEIYILLGVDLRTGWPSLAVSIVLISVCLYLGLQAQNNKLYRVPCFTVATVLFALMLANIAHSVPKWNSRATLPLIFLGVWVLYPVAFWLKKPAGYNVLDMVSKGLFGVFTAAKAF